MLAALLLIATTASAPLTLPEAFARAASRNLALQAARQRVPIAEAGVKTAGMLPNPTVSFSYGEDDPRFIAGLGMHLPFFGQRGASIAAARAQVPVSESEVQARAVQLHASMRRSYYALAAAEAHVQTAEETAGLAQQLANLARVREDAGAGTRLDVQQATLAAKRAASLRDQAAATRDAAQPILNALLGDPADAAVSVVAELSVPPPPPPLSELLAKMDQHPLVLGPRRERGAAMARLSQARVELRPAPDATLELSTLPGAPGGVGVRGTIAFGAPILSWNQGPVALAEAEADEAAARELAAKADLDSRLRAGLILLQAAVKRAQFTLQDQIPAAQEVEALARVAYKEGKAPLLTVLQAQADVASARNDAIDAVTQAQQALADVEEAAGVAFE